MTGGEEADLIPLSALQHYLYCPRQCALIHVERQWAENRFTAEGRVLHERAAEPSSESRAGVKTVRAMPLRSIALGVFGVADVVELRNVSGNLVPYPVEYKRGKVKAHRADEVQLCAQAICLEEMFGCTIAEGALFYGETRRRKAVSFDNGLRLLTREVAAATATLIQARAVPAPVYEPRKCDNCSLSDICRPKQMGKRRDVTAWLNAILDEE